MRAPIPQALLLALTFGCSSSPSMMSVPRSNLSEAEAAKARAACTFTASTPPALSLAKSAPLGDQIPIDQVVVLMLENRSFDYLLGDLPAAGQSDVAVASSSTSNPGPNGERVARHRLDAFCFEDTHHSWGSSHADWDNGRNDGFARSNVSPTDPTGSRAMGFYGAQDLPYLNALASAFAIGDRYFSPLLGPTDPNRLFFYAASAFGQMKNGVNGDKIPNLFDALDRANIKWIEYHEGAPASALVLETFFRHYGDLHYPTLPQFFTDAAAGKLPPVVLLDANESLGSGPIADDGHPPSDIQLAEQFLMKIVSAIVSSPQWPHLALFITFDEGGGLYDHLPPPTACPPDGLLPKTGTAAFDRRGFRVPLILVSPFARRNFVSHTVYDHTSILRFIETRFAIPALSARDANADPMLELFDFAKPNSMPPALPAPVLDQSKLADCVRLYGPDASTSTAGADAGLPD